MAITPDDVLFTAQLARLELRPEQTKRLGRDPGHTLGFVGFMRAVDVTDVRPLIQFAWFRGPLPEDRMTASLRQNDALAGAPDQKDGVFRVF